MTEKTFIEDYIESLDAEVEKVSKQIVSGKCSDFTDYLARCREVKAYGVAKDKFMASFKKYFREEEEDHFT